MMLTAAGPGRRQTGDHVGTDGSNQADVIAENLLPSPLLERFIDAEREAEVHGAREVLLGAVEAVQGLELLRPQHAERFEDFRSDLVLPAVAARRRRQRGAISLTAVQHHEQRVVLVVGVRRRHHEDAGVVQMTQHQTEGGVPLLLRHRHHAHLRARNADTHCARQEQSENDQTFHVEASGFRPRATGCRARAQECRTLFCIPHSASVHFPHPCMSASLD
jgi:hypothetical protein